MEEDLYTKCKRIFQKMYIYEDPLVTPDPKRPGVYTINIHLNPKYVSTEEDLLLLEEYRKNPPQSTIDAFRKIFNSNEKPPYTP